MKYWPAKAPGESLDYEFDFTAELQEGEAIASQDVTATGGTASNIAQADGKITFTLSGGSLGTPAVISAFVTTDSIPPRVYVETAIVPVGHEPVSIPMVKEYLGLFDSDRDAKIAGMIPRARLWVEDYTGFALVRRQFEERRRSDHGAIRLFKGPLVSVDSVTYGDGLSFTPRTFAPDTRIVADSAWPPLDVDDAFLITYTAGFAIGEVDERLIGAVLALVEGEFSEGFAYPPRSVEAAQSCCGQKRMMVV